MKSNRLRLTKGVALIAALAVVASCGLPRSGPTKNEIFSGSVMEEGDAFVLLVDDRVNLVASVTPALGFSAGFRDAASLGSDTIRAGDVLGLTIWENVRDPLLVPAGQNATVLAEVQVDGSGFIFVPYAGRIRAAGNTPEAIRRIITTKLEEQTPDPQVQVRRLAGDGATVSVVGAVGAQGVYAIERPTRTLAAMLARAGGVSVQPEIAQVTVVRGSHSGSIWFEDLYDHPGHDIALRAGDRIFVEQDTRNFTALGATGAQSRVSFESQTISAIEAIAQVGGLSTNLADPTGVFVFRNEPEEIANQLVGRTDLVGTQRVVYVLDLTEPNGMFMARDFSIRDGDTVYVTEAPYSQFSKTISAVFGTLNAVDAATSL
ncbi:polysaccharide biosynthesis/export family protein [Octadecabacter sp. 1_MG-2023]|uniref:polysaccharide biosynthesis/export family protein n=1 Tax=unclassified Octadecabacter TaxID=196158 RepID=UPI001C0809C1|nr:polysaccharide biosynthesis/export family protein [Octadecabacter sp. 1_MG-2023]MBU2992743.1 polysaccharide biosynthesis/export family protein [Octadecabacter sp. B2R22]MDO6733806.1 polysaccharide biosynthesis/export family protein [Octadecabacter sp. 1_MG-2023]